MKYYQNDILNSEITLDEVEVLVKSKWNKAVGMDD